MNKLILGLSSLVLFACCSKESSSNGSSEIPNTDDEGVEINFNSGVVASSLVNVSTRGVLERAIPKGEHVGIYGIPAIKNNPTDYTIDKFPNQEDYQENLFNANYEVTSVSGTISYLQQQFAAKFPSNKSGKDALAFYGYYPYVDNSAIETLGKGTGYIPIQLNKDDMSKTSDYLYTGQIVSGIAKTVSLTFQHALGRLDFKIYSTDGILANKFKINSITVKANHSIKGYMSLINGSINPTNTQPIDYVYPLTDAYVQYLDEINGQSISELPAIASFLLIPGDRIASITCSVTEVATSKNTVYEIYKMEDIPNQQDRIILKKGQTINANVLYSPRDVNASGKLNGWTTAETRAFTINANTPTN